MGLQHIFENIFFHKYIIKNNDRPFLNKRKVKMPTSCSIKTLNNGIINLICLFNIKMPIP